MSKKPVVLIVLLSMLLVACQTFDLFPSGNTGGSDNSVKTSGSGGNLNAPASPLTGSNSNNNKNVAPSKTPTPVPTNTPTPVPTNTPTPVAVALGPDNFPGDVNPLTCLPVKDPSSLTVPPALISITNFPASARPQSGLAWANWVIEGYIGEGMNRFLGIFHGDYPTTEGMMTLPDTGDSIGPIRSGRVWYEDWRSQFSGYLIAASAAPQVLSQLGGLTSIFGSDEGDINSALIPIDKLQAIAEANPNQLGPGALNSNVCDSVAPDGGRVANSFFVFYAPLNQALWKFEPSLGAYQRYQDDTVTGETFSLMQDAIGNQPLKFENLIIVYTNFHGRKDTYFYMDLQYNKGPAQILRDGKLYNIRWSTEAGDYEIKTGKNRPMRFTYENGDPFPLKPGQTWILLAPLWSISSMHETLAEGDYSAKISQVTPGSGHWAIQIFGPHIEK